MTPLDRAVPPRAVPRRRQRVGGALIAVVGAAIAAIAWQQAHTRGEFSLAGAFLGPAFLVMGAALVAWPGYREERLARGESLEGMEGAELLTPRWWGVLAAALAAGGAYVLALARGWIAA